MQKTTPKLEPACFVIKSFEEVGRAIAYMHRHHANALSDGKPLVVRIDQKADQRSAAQNRLFYMWMSELQRKTGQSEDSLKFFFKKKFLAKIYVRDIQDMAEKYESIRYLKSVLDRMDDGDPEKAKGMAHYENIVTMFILRYVSTTLANVKQFTEFLNNIHDYATVRLNVYLTIPDDLKWCYENMP